MLENTQYVPMGSTILGRRSHREMPFWAHCEFSFRIYLNEIKLNTTFNRVPLFWHFINSWQTTLRNHCRTLLARGIVLLTSVPRIGKTKKTPRMFAKVS